jgi:hypothetical protein
VLHVLESISRAFIVTIKDVSTRSLSLGKQLWESSKRTRRIPVTTREKVQPALAEALSTEMS